MAGSLPNILLKRFAARSLNRPVRSKSITVDVNKTTVEILASFSGHLFA